MTRSVHKPTGASGHLPYFSDRVADIAANRLQKIKYFSEADYLDLNPDVRAAGVPAGMHAIRYGASEGRRLFKPESVARALGSTLTWNDSPESAEPSSATAASGGVAAVGDITIYVSSLGNVFMREIALDFENDFKRRNLPVRVLDENGAVELQPGTSIFIAPHEFFVLGRGPNWVRDDIVENAFVYNTEQLQTSWFARAVPVTMAARGILDISSQAALLFTAAGVPSLHVEPGIDLTREWLRESDWDHPLMSVLPARARQSGARFADWRERPIDISFFGTESARRELFFGRAASTLAEYSTCVYYRRQSSGPILRNSGEEALTRLAGYVSGCSKISLNIHRDEFPYFEWHRMVRQGMASGALVVTDTCLPHPHLKPGVHFMQEDQRHVSNLLRWLLNDSDGQAKAEEVVRNASALISNDENHFKRTDAILNFVSSIA